MITTTNTTTTIMSEFSRGNSNILVRVI
jgi:hypothetical protein